jgi:hypothetical protein
MLCGRMVWARGRQQDREQEEQEDRDMSFAEQLLLSSSAAAPAADGPDDAAPGPGSGAAGLLVQAQHARQEAAAKDVHAQVDYLDVLGNLTDAESMDLAMVQLYRAHRARMRAQASTRKKQEFEQRGQQRRWRAMRLVSSLLPAPRSPCPCGGAERRTDV